MLAHDQPDPITKSPEPEPVKDIEDRPPGMKILVEGSQIWFGQGCAAASAAQILKPSLIFESYLGRKKPQF